MRRRMMILAVISMCAFVKGSAFAQTTNSSLPWPATKLESFDTNNSMLILKSSADIGSISFVIGFDSASELVCPGESEDRVAERRVKAIQRDFAARRRRNISVSAPNPANASAVGSGAAVMV